MSLQYLNFDYSEDEQGNACWDAMASVPPDRLPALVAEVCALLHWADHDYPGPQGAPDDGGDWDYDLCAEVDDHTHHSISYQPPTGASHEPPTGQLHWHPALAPQARRIALTLTLTGPPQFAQLLQQRWDL